jgi:hypothetical protein
MNDPKAAGSGWYQLLIAVKKLMFKMRRREKNTLLERRETILNSRSKFVECKRVECSNHLGAISPYCKYQ